MNIPVEELKYKSEYGINYGEYQEGYRIVIFFPDNSYKVQTFSGCIEGFMIDFVEVEPIEDESDIPPFISIDDLLSRYLNDLKDISAVAIYKVDGTLVAIKDRNSSINLNKIDTKPIDKP